MVLKLKVFLYDADGKPDSVWIPDVEVAPNAFGCKS